MGCKASALRLPIQDSRKKVPRSSTKQMTSRGLKTLLVAIVKTEVICTAALAEPPWLHVHCRPWLGRKVTDARPISKEARPTSESHHAGKLRGLRHARRPLLKYRQRPDQKKKGMNGWMVHCYRTDLGPSAMHAAPVSAGQGGGHRKKHCFGLAPQRPGALPSFPAF